MGNDLVILKVLTHSMNMVIAAEEKKWQRLSELDSQWNIMLSDFIENNTNSLETVIPQLLENNKRIQESIILAQENLAEEFKEGSSSQKAIKQYLK